MNKYLTLAAGATLLLGAAVGTAIPARAQAAAGTTTAASGPFQDVPADHWAYAAVNTLQKAGIVIGYPDGTYGGRRAMTRYEFAEAIARLLPQINNIDTSQFAKQSDLLAFESDTNAKLASDDAAISALQALVNEFQPELTQLGTDVDAIKRRLDADEDRLAAVEEEQKRVKITGDVNFVLRDNVNSSNHSEAPLDENGYRSGIDNSPLNTETAHSTSAWFDPNVYNDILLTIDGRVSDTAHAIVKIDASDYYAGSYDGITPTYVFNDEGDSARANFIEDSDNETVNDSPFNETFSIFRAYLDQPVNIGIDSNADLQAGRIDEQFTPFTLKAVIPDAYVQLPEDSTGNVGIDGAKLNFATGPVKVNIYAGKSNDQAGFDEFGLGSSVNPTGLSAESPSNSHAGGTQVANEFERPGARLVDGDEQVEGGELNQVEIDQSAGTHITFGAPGGFTVGVTGLLARVSEPIEDDFFDNGLDNIAIDSWSDKPYDTIGVYGADLHGPIPGVSGLGFDGEYAISQTGSNSQFGNVNSTGGNEAWNANLSYNFGPVGVKAGYEQIYNNFEAPGYWGTIGSWSNPLNVKGGVFSANYSPMSALSLTASGNVLQGISTIDNSDGVSESPLGHSDDLDSFKVNAKYAFNSAYNVDLGYEWVQWNLKGDTGVTAGKPLEQYINIGVGHPFSSNATLKLLYQIINFSASSTGTSFDPGGDSWGGVAVSQLEVKF